MKGLSPRETFLIHPSIHSTVFIRHFLGGRPGTESSKAETAVKQDTASAHEGESSSGPEGWLGETSGTATAEK